MRLFLALLIFLVTLVSVITRPRGIHEAYYALAGAAAAFLLGLISWQDVSTVVGIVWNATLALIAVMMISQVLDEAGFFRWAALHLARMAGSSGLRLFWGLNVMAALVTIFFNNDGSILIVTPIAYELLVALGLTPAATLPFLFATGFMADAASVPLVVSNLTNIVTSDLFAFGFIQYARLLLAPGIVAIGAAVVVMTLVLRKQVDLSLAGAQSVRPHEAIRDPFLFCVGIGVMVTVIIGYLVGASYGVPVSLVALSGAVILLAATYKNKVVNAPMVLRQAPWLIVLFAMGMYLVVYALRNVGLTELLGRWVLWSLNAGGRLGVWFTGLLFAFVSGVMNNLPSVMTGDLTIQALPLADATKHLLAAANVIGCDIGPKLTPIGSLATLLWMHILRGKGIEVTGKDYLRFGLIVTPPVLLAALLVL